MLNLGGADARICAIAGYGYETPVNLTLVDDEFYYRYDTSGDGTVPTSRAALDGCEAWYCNVAHNDLTRSPEVHEALLQLLKDDAPKLPGAPPMQHLTPRSATDSELRTQFNEKIDWSSLDATQRRQYLDSLTATRI
jgi:hypothetical protein